VEVCHPLRDRLLLEYCDRMPLERIGPPGTKPRAVRAATADLVPAEVIAREKTRLAVPDLNQRWRARYARPIIGHLYRLADSDTCLHEYLDLRYVARPRGVGD